MNKEEAMRDDVGRSCHKILTFTSNHVRVNTNFPEPSRSDVHCAWRVTNVAGIFFRCFMFHDLNSKASNVRTQK